MFTITRDYALQASTIPILIARVHRFFSLKGFLVQDIPDEYSTILQARKVNVLRDLTGLSSVITVRIWREGDGVRVQTKSERWPIRAAVFFIGFMLPPIFLVPCFGGYLQYKAVDELWVDIGVQVSKLLTDRHPPG